jgi:hypothetical protein
MEEIKMEIEIDEWVDDDRGRLIHRYVDNKEKYMYIWENMHLHIYM